MMMSKCSKCGSHNVWTISEPVHVSTIPVSEYTSILKYRVGYQCRNCGLVTYNTFEKLNDISIPGSKNNPYTFECFQNLEFTIDEFIKLTKTYSDSFICYCEAIMTSIGKIILASPSHQIALRNHYKNLDLSQLDDRLFINYHEYEYEYLCRRFKCLLIWYSNQKGYKVNRFQRYSLRKLIDAGLIKYNLYDYNDHMLHTRLYQ